MAMIGDGEYKAKIMRFGGAGLGTALSALLLLSLTVSPASAERLDHRGTQEEQAACTPDVFRLCSQFIPSESRIVACLVASRAQLSPACSKVFGGPPPRAASTRTKTRRAAAPRRTATGTKRPPAAKKTGPRTTQRGKARASKSPG
jgi:hypothetical protein